MENHWGRFDREQFPEGEPCERKHVRRSLLYGGPRARYSCAWRGNDRRLDWRGAPLTASNLCSVCRHCSHCSHPGTRNLRRDVGRTWTAGVCGTAQEAATYLNPTQRHSHRPRFGGVFHASSGETITRASSFWSGDNTALTPCSPGPSVPKSPNSNAATDLLFFASDAVKPLTFAVRISYLR